MLSIQQTANAEREKKTASATLDQYHCFVERENISTFNYFNPFTLGTAVAKKT